MRVGLYLPYLSGGGSEVVTLNLARGLADTSIHPIIILEQSGGVLDTEMPDNVDQVCLHSNSKLNTAYRIAKYSIEKNVKVLHTSLYRAAPVVALSSLFSKGQLRTVVEVENPLDIVYRKENLLKRLSRRYLLFTVFSIIDKLLAVSEDVASGLSEFTNISEDYIDVVGNPIDIESITSMRKKKNNRHSSPIIMSMGRFSEQKNFETLVKSLSIIADDTNAELLILGRGNKKNDIHSLVEELQLSDRVSLPGFVKDPYKYLAHADVFVLPSRYEGFGNVLVEAMAMGVPVIATDCVGGPSEILGQGRWGELVPVADSSSMAVSIKEVLNRKVSAGRLKKRANKYNKYNISEKYIQVFKEVV
jgi:glycosyltransferase involved in cell wall biosynthesis